VTGASFRRPSLTPRCGLRRIIPSRLPRRCLSGLDRTAPSPAVYASSRPSPGRHARLAPGWRPCLCQAGLEPAGSV